MSPLSTACSLPSAAAAPLCPLPTHSDISLWSFEKLADPKLGVIAIESRDVPCWQRPHKPARNPWGQRSGPDRGPPGNWNPAQDKRCAPTLANRQHESRAAVGLTSCPLLLLVADDGAPAMLALLCRPFKTLDAQPVTWGRK
jgi:hypothetical protein